MNTGLVATELLISTATSTAIATNVDANSLVTALITFGVSLITMVGGELVKYLVSYLKNKRTKIDKDTDKINKDDSTTK